MFIILVASNMFYSVNAESNTSSTPNNVESIYKQLGYKQFEKSVSEFKNQNNISEIKLPTKYPFKITNKFGKIDPFDENTNRLNLHYLNFETKQVFKIFISCKEQTTTKALPTEEVITLSDGTEARFDPHHISGTSLRFEKDDLIYYFYLPNKSQKYKITKKELINIAESLK